MGGGNSRTVAASGESWGNAPIEGKPDVGGLMATEKGRGEGGSFPFLVKQVPSLRREVPGQGGLCYTAKASSPGGRYKSLPLSTRSVWAGGEKASRSYYLFLAQHARRLSFYLGKERTTRYAVPEEKRSREKELKE